MTHKDTMMTALPMKSRGLKMNCLRAVTALMLSVALAAPAMAASAPYLRIANRTAGTLQSVQIEVSKSMLVDLPTNAGEVIASDPNVANVIMRSKTRAIVQGKTGGSTNIFFLDPAGNNIAVLDVNVVQPSQAESQVGAVLQSTLARAIPGSNIRVQTLSNDAAGGPTQILLTGTVRTAEDKAVAESLASQLGGTASSLIQVSGPQQVMLKVTVAEVQRDVAKQLGVNFSSTFSVAGVSGSFNNAMAPGAGAGGGGLNIPLPGGSGISGSVDVAVKALEQRGALRTLATPVLTALSGQPASFLAGGELPYNRVVDGNVVTEFKPYGIELAFTPTIKSDGTISLLVNSSVSEPANQGALNKRDVSTTVVLGAGQTLSIAGLLSERARQDIDRLPGLGNIPIIGALFRSREYRAERTELVFLVTPYYAWAQKGQPELPTDHVELAGDAEAIFLGHLEKMYGVGNDGMRGSYRGSVGFVLD